MPNPLAVISGVYFMCALMGHEWRHVRTSRNYRYYECRICERRRKEDR